MSQGSPRSLAIMKRQIRKTYAQSLAIAGTEMENRFASFDFKERLASFVEMCAPAFERR